MGRWVNPVLLRRWLLYPVFFPRVNTRRLNNHILNGISTCQGLLRDPPELSLMRPALPLSMSVPCGCWRATHRLCRGGSCVRKSYAFYFSSSHGVPTKQELAKIGWTSLFSSSPQTAWCMSGLPCSFPLLCPHCWCTALPTHSRAGNLCKPSCPCPVPWASFSLSAPL